MAPPPAPPGPERRLRLTQVRGWASCSKKQLKVLRGLGLGRTHRVVVREDTPSIRGMIARIPHVLDVRPIDASEVK